MNASRFDLPDDLKPLLDLASLDREIRESGGSDIVEGRLKRAIENHPEHGVPLAAWAWFLSRNEDYVGAVAWQTRAIEKGPDEFRVMWRTQRAAFRFRTGDWQTGFVEFRELIVSEPGNPLPRIARSFEMKSMGDHVSGELDEIFVRHMVGNVSSDTLFVFLRENGAFASPDRLKASLFVLSDPLDVIARIHRGEMFMSMGAPLAAYYDLHLADVLKPRNLGLMARIEDIRTRGILADPPNYEVSPPSSPILPAYEAVLEQYSKYLEKVVPAAVRGRDFGWLERLVNRLGPESLDFDMANRNFFVAGLLIGGSADFLAIAAATMIHAFAAPNLEPLKEWGRTGALSVPTVIGGVVFVVYGLGIASAAVLMTIALVQTLCGCRIADMPAIVKRKPGYLRPLLVYGIGMASAASMVLSVLFHGVITVLAVVCLSILAELAGFSILNGPLT